MSHEDQSGLKICRICCDDDDGQFKRTGCPFCHGTGLVEDLRSFGCCEGHYFGRCTHCSGEMMFTDKRAITCLACALKMKKERMPKAPPPPAPTAAQIEQASRSAFMSDLIAVARSFGRAGINAPFTVALPQLVQGWVKEKNGYRKIAIKAGAQFDVQKITMGKKAGLLFCFTPMGEPVADKDNPEWIELEWNDVVNAFGDLADDVDQRFADAQAVNPTDPVIKTASDVNNRLKQAITANAGMHGILKAGFEKAYTAARDDAQDDSLASLPGFGQF